MVVNLKELKKIRKSIGLTQSELAKATGLSQSLIAKIEADKLDPSYSNAMTLMNTLNSLSESKGLKAVDVMQKKVISCASSETLREAIDKMRKYEISQLPILQKDQVVGLISEKGILDEFTSDKPRKDLRVADVMEEAPPTISEQASFDAIISLMKHFPLVLVVSKGVLKGVITKSDLIMKMY